MRSRSLNLPVRVGACIVASGLVHCAVAPELSRPDASRVDASAAMDTSVERDGGVAFDSGLVMQQDVAMVRDVTASDGSCPLGLVACGATCVDLMADPLHCGRCDNRCAAGANGMASCESGTCRLRCQMGFGDCDGNPANGCETPLNSASNCGMCGRACSGATPVCDARTGTCASGCMGGQTRCGMSCVDTASDVNHCGACGRTCTVDNGSARCEAGMCGVLSCNVGFGDCDGNPANGCETPLDSASNCGMCGRACVLANATTTCAAGACVIATCNAGFGDCDGNPANGCETPLNSASNCGMCGRACVLANATTTCATGTCSVLACNVGFADCDRNPANGCEVNTHTDVNNCGGCGNRPIEVCNGVDDDCDGVVDEGYRAQIVYTTYTALSTHHGGCTAATRFGPDCNAAIKRFCAARGCTSSGFGPVENSGDNATVVCTKGEEVMTRYSTLSTFHSGCNGTSERFGPNCNAAINRFCMSRGAVSGFGPVENSGDTAYVQCVFAPWAQMVMTRYSTLSTFHSGCNGTSERFGPNCNAAINRFCMSRGAVSGFGPVENSGDTAIVVCVTP